MNKGENKEEVKVTGGKIDKETLDIMKQNDILKSFSDEKQEKRLILNCFCELLGVVRELKASFEELSQMISVISADKLANYFKEVQKNFAVEENRAKIQEKISKSHKKSTKKAKKV